MIVINFGGKTPIGMSQVQCNYPKCFMHVVIPKIKPETEENILAHSK